MPKEINKCRGIDIGEGITCKLDFLFDRNKGLNFENLV